MTTNNAIRECRMSGGKSYFVTSDEEVAQHFLQVVNVTCSNCDKTDEGTPADLESRGWWLKMSTVCSIECLFALADAKTAAMDTTGCPF